MKQSRNLLVATAAAILVITLGYFSYQNYRTKSDNQPRFHAIIFDMDGTTLDTDHMWKNANGPILDSHAPHLTQEEKDAIIANFHNQTIYEIWKLIEEQASIAISNEEIIRENIKHLHDLYDSQGISFIPNFHEFHTQAQNRNLKTAIATSSEQPTIDVITKVVPLNNYFGQHIYNADHVNRAYKPQPDVYLYAADKLGVQPCNCIAIEDSSGGIKAAKAAGMYCIGINTGKNRAALAHADEIVDCYTQIDLEKLLSLAH
jgi:HAD superfamily hydrolase (TIGR01509 family)